MKEKTFNNGLEALNFIAELGWAFAKIADNQYIGSDTEIHVQSWKEQLKELQAENLITENYGWADELYLRTRGAETERGRIKQMGDTELARIGFNIWSNKARVRYEFDSII